MNDTPINSRDFVNSLARGLDVLRTFSQDSRAMTLSEVAAKANLSLSITKSVVDRVLQAYREITNLR